MDIAAILLQHVTVGGATYLGTTLTAFAVRTVKSLLGSADPPKAYAGLAKMGSLSRKEIQQAVLKAFPVKPDAPKNEQRQLWRQREELTALLMNLSHAAQGVASRETPSSLSRNMTETVDEMLADVDTVRRPGEAVAVGREDWVLTRFLGRGAFGEVWLGRHQHDRNLMYAFKFFTLDNARDWIQREQHSLARIRERLGKETRIVQLADFALHNQKYPFLVLEYVSGGSLEEWIREGESRRPKLRKNDVIYDIVRALAVAHGHGICHRDLKPGNVLLTAPPDAQAKVTDFGLADIRTLDPFHGDRPAPSAAQGKPHAAAPARRSLYASHVAAQVGTPMYWPPEAWQPFANREAAQDDVFAIGVIWYQLLVDRLERPPYDFAEVLRSHEVDSHTVRIISQCLACPDRRFKDARAVLEAIEFLPPDEIWLPPKDGFNVGPLAREYLASQPR